MVSFACGKTVIQKLQMVAQGQRERQCNQVSTKITAAKKWITERGRIRQKKISTEITLPVAVTSYQQVINEWIEWEREKNTEWVVTMISLN